MRDPFVAYPIGQLQKHTPPEDALARRPSTVYAFSEQLIISDINKNEISFGAEMLYGSLKTTVKCPFMYYLFRLTKLRCIHL